MIVSIDFSKNNIKCGYVNENISTTLDITVPEDMLDYAYKYKVAFQAHRFEQFKSDYIQLDDNNHIIYKIPSAVTFHTSTAMQLIAYDENDGMVRKSKMITLVFGESVIGREMLIDPFKNVVKVAELKILDNGKTNMSASKLIEYVKQNYLILFVDDYSKSQAILFVYTYVDDAEEKYITFVIYSIEDDNLSGLAYITINNDCNFTVTNGHIIAEDVIYQQLLGGSISVKTKIQEIEENVGEIESSVDSKIEEIETAVDSLSSDVELNTAARHTHNNKSVLDNITEGNNGNLYYNGEEYYNAADVDQAIADAEGDLIEITLNNAINLSKYTSDELNGLNKKSKGFSFQGRPVIGTHFNPNSHYFYFQYCDIGSSYSISAIHLKYVDPYKDIRDGDPALKYIVYKINDKESVDGKVTIYAEDIQAESSEWYPTNDTDIATKKYVDENGGSSTVEIRKSGTTANYTSLELSSFASQGKIITFDNMPIMSWSLEGGIFYFSTINIDYPSIVVGYRANNSVNSEKVISLQSPRYIPIYVNNKSQSNGNITLTLNDIVSVTSSDEWKTLLVDSNGNWVTSRPVLDVALTETTENNVTTISSDVEPEIIYNAFTNGIDVRITIRGLRLSVLNSIYDSQNDEYEVSAHTTVIDSAGNIHYLNILYDNGWTFDDITYTKTVTMTVIDDPQNVGGGILQNGTNSTIKSYYENGYKIILNYTTGSATYKYEIESVVNYGNVYPEFVFSSSSLNESSLNYNVRNIIFSSNNNASSSCLIRNNTFSNISVDNGGYYFEV